MGYIGTKPSAVPLTSADITDGIITSAKIADGTIVNADINASAAIVNSKLSGVGITEADQWRLTVNLTAPSNAFVTANWERVDTDGFNYLGTGMTESSGVFSFPSTGYYLILAHAGYYNNGGAYADNSFDIHTTINNSTYGEATSNVSSGYTNNAHDSSMTSFIFDVTSTANCKVKFQANTTGIMRAYTDKNATHVTFIRLGDT